MNIELHMDLDDTSNIRDKMGRQVYDNCPYFR